MQFNVEFTDHVMSILTKDSIKGRGSGTKLLCPALHTCATHLRCSPALHTCAAHLCCTPALAPFTSDRGETGQLQLLSTPGTLTRLVLAKWGNVPTGSGNNCPRGNSCEFLTSRVSWYWYWCWHHRHVHHDTRFVCVLSSLITLSMSSSKPCPVTTVTKGQLPDGRIQFYS